MPPVTLTTPTAPTPESAMADLALLTGLSKKQRETARGIVLQRYYGAHGPTAVIEPDGALRLEWWPDRAVWIDRNGERRR